MNNNQNRFSSTEFNRLQQEMERVARETKWEYPVAITQGENQEFIPTLLDLREVGKPEVFEHGNVKRDNEGKLVSTHADGKLPQCYFRGEIRTYEFINRAGEVKRFKLPVMEGMSLSEMYKLAADIIQFAEVLRKFVNISTMTTKAVINACPNDVGLVLADKLLGLPGLTNSTEQILRSAWAKSGSTQNFNNFLKNHEQGKLMVELKDKFISNAAEQYAEACRGIASNLDNVANNTPAVSIATTNVPATVLNESPAAVREVSSITEQPKGLKNIL